MKQISVITAVLFFGAVLAQEPEVVSNLQRCDEQDSECLTPAIQEAVDALMNGLPEFDMPQLDPFYTESKYMEYQVGPIRSSAVTKDVYTYGMKNIEVLAVRSTPSEGRHHLEVDVYFPKIFIEGNYTFDGYLAEFHLGGEGYFNISMTDVSTTWNMDGPVNNDIWTVERFIMLPDVGDMRVYFDDLFNGNAILNVAARNIINQFWQLFYRAMLPGAAKAWDPELSGVVNKFFGNVPYSQFF